MRVKPTITYYLFDNPVYRCTCGEYFRKMDLLNNKPMKGTRDYCPRCKTKFTFTETNY